MSRYVRAVGALCALVALLSGCARDTASERYSETIVALDTVADITVYGARGEAAISAAKDALSRYESLLSVTLEGSDIYRINNAKGKSVSVDPDTSSLILYARELSEITGGSFDITVYPVVRAWGFTTPEFRIPAQNELDQLLQYVGYSQITADDLQRTVTVPDGVMLDLGGVAKGYIGDRMIDAIRETGAVSAIINLGGNVQTLGVKPDGSDWTISIRDPNRPAATFCTVTTGEGAVITSGSYERYFIGPEGERYHHIIDTTTGYPARSGLLSVTVVSSGDSGRHGFYGDGLTTAMFVKGRDGSLELWRELGGTINGVSFELIIVTETGEVVITPGLTDRVTLTSGEYTLTVAEADE